MARTTSFPINLLRMSRLQTVLSFLALPAEQQIQLLPEIPYDRGARDYYPHLDSNPMPLLVRGIVADCTGIEGESDADYQARTGIRAYGACAALNELCCFIGIFQHALHADNYWNQRALTGRDEWRLVRRLATLALEEAGWRNSCARDEILSAAECFQRELP